MKFLRSKELGCAVPIYMHTKCNSDPLLFFGINITIFIETETDLLPLRATDFDNYLKSDYNGNLRNFD